MSRWVGKRLGNWMCHGDYCLTHSVPRASFAFPRVFHPSSLSWSCSIRRLSTPKNDWNYDHERNHFSLPCPDSYNFTHDQVEARGDRESDASRIAFWWVNDDGKEIRWSWAQLASLTRQTSAVLEGPCGLRRGDRLMIVTPRLPEWWLVNLACIRSGIVLIPGTPQLTPRDVQYRMDRSNAACLVTGSSMAPHLESTLSSCRTLRSRVFIRDGIESPTPAGSWIDLKEAIAEADPDHPFVPTEADDPMMIFFTSGTTGYPKMALHTQASYGLASIITGKYMMDFVPGDVHWNFADLGWAKAAWSNLFAPWIQGACVFIYHPNRLAVKGFPAQSILRVLKDFPISTFCTAPSAVSLLVQENLDLFTPFAALRHCFTGGEALRPDVARKWFTATGVEMRELYGQTELVVTLGNFLCIENRLGSMGKPAPGMDVRVIDSEGHDCPPGVEGDVAVKIKPVRPLGMFHGYVDDPVKTASCFKGDFYVTGDRASRDDGGYFWFVGRDDDIINTSSYRVGPVEVEAALVEHPDVVEAAVVGIPDERRGQVVKAFVVPTERRLGLIVEASSSAQDFVDELQRHVKNLTAPYKYPRLVEFVRELPKTTSGKIRRVELRNAELEKTMTK